LLQFKLGSRTFKGMNSAKWKPATQSRRRLLKGAFLLAWGGAITVGAIYHQPIYLAIKTAVITAGGSALASVQVEGTVYTDKTELQTALNIKAGEALVPYNVGTARERLEALPWIKLAAVEKKLPDTLNVSVYEYIPVARVEEDGKWLVVSKDAVRILEDSANEFAGLPALTGVGAAEATSDLLVHLQDRPNFVAQLKTANYVGERRWDFTFKSGVMVRFPDENVAETFKLLEELEEARHVLSLVGGVVDLRLPGRVTLKIPPELNKTPIL